MFIIDRRDSALIRTEGWTVYVTADPIGNGSTPWAKRLGFAIAWFFMAAVLLTAYRRNPVLAHDVAETFSVVVACGVFMLTWNARNFIDNRYFIFLGTAYLFVGGIDYLHSLSFAGVFSPERHTSSIELWFASRFLQSFALLAAPLFVSRKTRPVIFLGAFSAVALALLGMVYYGVFPDYYVPGKGLTAAKRLSEATGADATTIHRALEFSPQTGGFRRGPTDPLKAQVVIVDETSMVDTYLMHHLLRAVPKGARLILVGDAHQLPAVGPGNVLKDLMASGVIQVVHLTQIYRQARESLIVVNAHRINQGEYPVLPKYFGKTDFVFLEMEEPPVLQRRLLDLVAQELPRRYGFAPLKDLQVITPMHRGPLGVQTLNHLLQERLNARSETWIWAGRTWRRGDKVMQLRNNYYKEIFNGDIGQIWGVDGATGHLQVNFDGRMIPYDPGEREEITLAYAITVHKAQGNEFPAVLLVLTTHHYLLLQRNLLYTGITRGRRLVVLLGSKKALGMAISNDKPIRRYTHLASRLRQSVAPMAGKNLDFSLPQGHNHTK